VKYLRERIKRQMFSDNFTDADIGRKYNVARGTINQGKTWINY